MLWNIMEPVYWRQVLELSHITMIYLDLQTTSCFMVVSIGWWFQIFTWKMVGNHHFHPLKQMVVEGHQVRYQYVSIESSEKLHETIPCSQDIHECLGSNSPPFGSENTSKPFSLYIGRPPKFDSKRRWVFWCLEVDPASYWVAMLLFRGF